MNNKKKILLLAILLLTLFVVWVVIKSLQGQQGSIETDNLTKLEDKIYSLADGKYKLSDAAPFDWDFLYAFEPYTSKDEIFKAIGFESNRVTETFDESMQQIIFVKNKEIVCYVYGSPFKLGYEFSFEMGSKKYIELKSSEDNFFHFHLEDKLRILDFEQ